MGCGNLVIALDTPFNSENLEGTGVLWEKRLGSLAERIKQADADPDEVRRLGGQAQRRIAEHYSWEEIARQHDAFFRDVARRRGLPV